jgi:DNA-binding NtrC family response regulator
MVVLRPPMNPPFPDSRSGCPGGGRLNLLLTHGGWQTDSWADRLPRLLEPLGVQAWRAGTGREATRIIQEVPVHLAVIDLSLPLDATPGQADEAEEAGNRVLDLLVRLDQPPPTVVITRPRSSRENARQMACALRAGVFAVIQPPVHLETALQVMQRALARFYADRWPGGPPPNPPTNPDTDPRAN